MRQHTRRRTWLAIATVTVVAAGCGSTVRGTAGSSPNGDGLTLSDGGGLTSGTTGGGGGTGTGIGGTGTGSGTSTGIGGTGTGSGTSTGIGGTGTGTGTGSGSGSGNTNNGNGGSPTGSGPTSGATGPGITATTINVAAAYDPDAAAADKSLGASGAAPGDAQAETNAIIHYVNAHGGVAGRKLNPIFYRISIQKSAQESNQEACSQWTQDNKVFITQSLGGSGPIMDQCTANSHTVQLDTGQIVLETTAQNQHFPADIDLTGLTIDRSMKVTVNGLAKQGYFATGAKVGIVTWADPFYTYSISHGAVPALAAHGLHNVPVQYITVPQSYGDLGATSASINSAVLKYRGMGINHVILFDGGAGVTNSSVLVLLWMRDADSQHYTPRYGLNSTSGFSTLAPELPKSQEIGAIGVGWLPGIDLTTADYPDSQLSPRGRLCLKIFKDAGQGASGNNDKEIQFGYCDAYFYLQHVLDRVKGPLNQQTALAAINASGSTYQPLGTFGINITSGQHDGVQLVRNTAFNAGCDCYRYTSRPYHAG